jgi:hypothetical protein
LQDLPLKVERAEPWLPTEASADSTHPPKNYAKPLLAMAKLPGWLAFLADPLLNQRYPWKSRIEARDGFWSIPLRINAVRIGELALVSFAAETFTEIGLEVKANSPARWTLFASLTDGCISYLHTASSHPEGGYEVDTAPLAYRYPGRLKAECEGIALEHTRILLERLWQDEKLPSPAENITNFLPYAPIILWPKQPLRLQMPGSNDNTQKHSQCVLEDNVIQSGCKKSR